MRRYLPSLRGQLPEDGGVGSRLSKGARFEAPRPSTQCHLKNTNFTMAAMNKMASARTISPPTPIPHIIPPNIISFIITFLPIPREG